MDIFTKGALFKHYKWSKSFKNNVVSTHDFTGPTMPSFYSKELVLKEDFVVEDLTLILLSYEKDNEEATTKIRSCKKKKE